ncbi:MAG TPA: hypothetical protein VLC09_15570 [Polyangiaceae bacterium]|nr:hypothetical protein [Polyangiaceae bacterium]
MSVFRNNGYVAPLIGVGSLVIMMPATPETVRPYQIGLLVAWLVGGAWVVWYGLRSLRAAPEKLGRPLRWYEWVFDPIVWKPLPFDSFMLIQMPWWGLGFVAAIVALLFKITG